MENPSPGFKINDLRIVIDLTNDGKPCDPYLKIDEKSRTLKMSLAKYNTQDCGERYRPEGGCK